MKNKIDTRLEKIKDLCKGSRRSKLYIDIGYTDFDRTIIIFLASFDSHSGDWLHALPMPCCVFLESLTGRLSVG